MPTGAVEAPPNVTVRDYIPHDLVLPHMAAVVSHGGLSTVTAALTAGVPLVCIPQGRDQTDNARRVEATGVGRAVAVDAPASAIANALEELLADPAPRRAARDSPMSSPDWDPAASPSTRSSGCVDRHRPAPHGAGRAPTGRLRACSMPSCSSTPSPLASRRCARSSRAPTGITEVFSVAGGVADLIAIVRVRHHDDLAEVVTGRIATLPGIESTTTLVAFKAYSRHDLEAIWDLGPA